MHPFISEKEIEQTLEGAQPTRELVREIIAKSLNKKRLTMQETAVLVNAADPELVEEIKAGARKLKEQVYGKRIVLFAPLYVGKSSRADQRGRDAGRYGTEKADPGLW